MNVNNNKLQQHVFAYSQIMLTSTIIVEAVATLLIIIAAVVVVVFVVTVVPDSVDEIPRLHFHGLGGGVDLKRI